MKMLNSILLFSILYLYGCTNFTQTSIEEQDVLTSPIVATPKIYENSIYYAWGMVDEAISYKIEISVQIDFSSILIDSTIKTTSFKFSPTLFNQTYYARIKSSSQDEKYNSAWSLFSNIFIESPISSYYKEKYRPQFHFSPRSEWIADPCGLYYYNGQYNLYWWGRATSDDLLHFNQTSNGLVLNGFLSNMDVITGSIVVDKNNCAGFGINRPIALLTLVYNNVQSQGLFYSTDLQGSSFMYYSNNPILDIGSTSFRDPTVFFYEPTEKWIMIVAASSERKVKFYSSSDLKEWEWLSDFGPCGDYNSDWECPDFFELAVDGDSNNKKWVLIVSILDGKEQYFTGDFDGQKFSVSENIAEPRYVDFGYDYYASRTIRDYDGTLNSIISLGWLSSWFYGLEVPETWGGRGFWSIPRELTLKTDNGYKLIQSPYSKLSELRKECVEYSGELQEGTNKLPLFSPNENIYELEIEVEVNNTADIGFNLCVGDNKKISFIYYGATNRLEMDRTNCTSENILDFERDSYAYAYPQNNKIRFHFFVDKSSVELFVNDGKLTFSALTFPSDNQVGIESYSSESNIVYKYSAWELKSIW